MSSGYTRDVYHGTVAQAVAGVVGLCYTLLTARWLGRADFGLFQAVMAIYGVLITGGALLSGLAVHRVAAAPGDQRDAAVRRMLRKATVLGVCSGLVVLGASPLLVPWLKVDGSGPVVALAVLICVAIVLSTMYGCLQGANRYHTFMWVKSGEALIYLAGGSLLMALGAGVSGAILGYAAAMTVALVVLWRGHGGGGEAAADVSPSPDDPGALSVLAIYGTVFFVINAPAIGARMLLTPQQAGVYGALFALKSTVLPFAFAVCLPLYSRAVAHGDRSSALPALNVAATLCGTFLMVAWWFPEQVVMMLFGAEYRAAAPLMLLYGGFLTLHVLAMVWMFQQAGRGCLRPVLLVIPLAITAGVWIVRPQGIAELIMMQTVAWAAYLLVAVGVRLITGGRLDHARTVQKPECV